MNFNEKLKSLRKENGISQEDLAAQLEVSRQAVSRWESGQGYPETEKIVQLSNIFGVSIDYLLKEENAATEDTQEGYYVSREMTNGYVAAKKKGARNISVGVALIILGLVPMNLLDNEVIGTFLMFVFAAIGVGAIVMQNYVTNNYKIVEEKQLVFDSAFINEYRMEAGNLNKKDGIMVAIGIAIIILGFGTGYFLEELYLLTGDKAYGITFVVVALGVSMIIYFASLISARNVIAKNDEFLAAKEKEKRSSKYGWLYIIATAVFLIIGFVWNAWHPGWIVYLIATAIYVGLGEFSRRKQ